MTAGGDAERAGKAVGMIRSSIIGVTIIFFSYSITTYVFYSLMKKGDVSVTRSSAAVQGSTGFNLLFWAN
jgi:hypothetical protein